MSYTLDPDENKKNAFTPSEKMSLNEQFMYRLASLDASVQGGFRRLDEKMDRFQTDLHDSQISANDRISELDKDFKLAILAKRQRIDDLVKGGDVIKREIDTRLTSLETWKHVFMAKVGMLITAVVAISTLLAPTIRSALGIAN